MHFLSVLSALAVSSLVSALKFPTPTTNTKRGDGGFLTTDSEGSLTLNGEKYPYIAVEAHWLATLFNEKDVDSVLKDLSSFGVTNVVVPAYNVVNEHNKPGDSEADATWLQLVNSDGTITVNEGENGFKRLDKLVSIAKTHNIRIDFTLSHNYDPRAVVATSSNPGTGIVDGFNTTRPRNYLRNDFGGVDFLSASLGSKTHDIFTNDKITASYKEIVKCIVERYKDETTVGSWTPLKDAQCGGTLDKDPSCSTTVISQWHNDISEYIGTLDPNHIVVASSTGYECPDCTKLYNAPPVPQPSSAPGATRRSPKSRSKAILERRERAKRSRAEARRNEIQAGDRSGVKIRGRWVSSGVTGRQSNQVVPGVNDGSSGVDSVDLGNSAAGGLISSYLPFEHEYFVDQDNTDIENIRKLGNEWIKRQASIRDQLNKAKPVYITMGLPVSNFSDFFVYGNSSVNYVDSHTGLQTRQQNVIGVPTSSRDSVLQTWFSTAAGSNVHLVIQGAGATGVSSSPGTSYSNDNDSTSSSDNSDSTTSSPNDGYNIVANGNSDSGAQNIIRQASINLIG